MSKTNPITYHHEQNKNEEDDTKYVLNESGLYLVIFGYLPYEDILNGVYRINGMLYRISLTVLDGKYENFVYSELFAKSIAKLCPQLYLSLRLRKDTCIMLNALLMDVLDRIIDQCNVHESVIKACMKMGLNFEDGREIMQNIICFFEAL